MGSAAVRSTKITFGIVCILLVVGLLVAPQTGFCDTQVEHSSSLILKSLFDALFYQILVPEVLLTGAWLVLAHFMMPSLATNWRKELLAAMVISSLCFPVLATVFFRAWHPQTVGDYLGTLLLVASGVSLALVLARAVFVLALRKLSSPNGMGTNLKGNQNNGEIITVKYSRSITRLLLSACLVSSLAGCGEMTVPMWVTVDPAQSEGAITVLGETSPLFLSGGILQELTVDTNQALNSDRIYGDVEVIEVRLAADGPLGLICMAKDPADTTIGSLHIGIFSGHGDAELPLVLLAEPTVMPGLLIPYAADIGSIPFDLDYFNAADAVIAKGDFAGVMELDVASSTDIDFAGLPVNFDMSLHLSSAEGPPVDFDAATREGCRPTWALQGVEPSYPINAKGTYLREGDKDRIKAPRIIELADIAFADQDASGEIFYRDLRAGDTITITPHGDFQKLIGMSESDMIGVFSSSDVLLRDSKRYRVQGAVEAGANFYTKRTWCPPFSWWFCGKDRTDIGQDFLIRRPVTITVPPGATHLFVAAHDNLYKDNLAFDYWVEIAPHDFE